jgi:hypothetical protein
MHPLREVMAEARPEEEQLHLLRHLRVRVKEQLVEFDGKLGDRLELLLAQVAKLLECNLSDVVVGEVLDELVFQARPHVLHGGRLLNEPSSGDIVE